MTIHELAAKLDGREYRDEITHVEREQAKSAGLVVMFGYSDDGMYFHGAIEDTGGCWNGGEFFFDEKGLLNNECDNEDCPHYEKRKDSAKVIEVSDIPWHFITNIPHATFNIMVDDNLYGQGIVFSMSSLVD